MGKKLRPPIKVLYEEGLLWPLRKNKVGRWVPAIDGMLEGFKPRQAQVVLKELQEGEYDLHGCPAGDRYILARCIFVEDE